MLNYKQNDHRAAQCVRILNRQARRLPCHDQSRDTDRWKHDRWGFDMSRAFYADQECGGALQRGCNHSGTALTQYLPSSRIYSGLECTGTKGVCRGYLIKVVKCGAMPRYLCTPWRTLSNAHSSSLDRHSYALAKYPSLFILSPNLVRIQCS